jgi:hypothetical protein
MDEVASMLRHIQIFGENYLVVNLQLKNMYDFAEVRLAVDTKRYPTDEKLISEDTNRPYIYFLVVKIAF